jgi:hypothetical protein
VGYNPLMRASWVGQGIVLVGVMAGLSVGGGPALAQAIAITDRDCTQIVEHVASADINYKPGVDVYGRPVAPADLNGQPSQVQVPQTFTIDANADLRKYGVPSSSALLLPSVNIGKIRVEDSGRSVYFNDQPIGNTEQRALAEACKARGLRR